MSVAIPVTPQPAVTAPAKPYVLQTGNPQPLGATPDDHGVNFSLFSQHADKVQLLLFDQATDPDPSQTIDVTCTTGFYWHVYVEGLKPGAFYAYRVSGPDSPDDLSRCGHRYNANRILLDPYARGNVDNLWVAADATDAHPEDNVHTAMRSVVIEMSQYDWEGDRPLNRPRNETIIYELHVKGFTASSSSGCHNPGTFSGIIEKIPYLQQLGITAVELMPIFDFDGKSPRGRNPVTGEILHNYWGYDPFGFFAPQSEYCVSPNQCTHIQEFRDMVKALHRAGIEVILDVVFNHTGEGDQNGPTISFRGIDNSVYYYLQDNDHRYYRDYTGCGNSVNCNHPAVSKMFEECLHFWVNDMHVDGFRFDLGSLLAIGEDGQRLRYPPIVWAIDLDETLANIKVIVEPYGAGVDVLGSFPDMRFATWNWRYKNTIRQFVRGDRGIVGDVASRISGSSDLSDQNSNDSGGKPVNMVSYITCHDGFTMNDLVSYNGKHNETNGEDSGDNNNLSWNCGVEGATTDPTIESFRERQIRNMFAILFLSQGIPMILSGDECRRTQNGNNNAYLQDNAISWFDWQLTKNHADLIRFVSSMVAFRKHYPALRRETFFTGQPVVPGGLPDIAWHGCQLNSPGWNNPQTGVLAFTLASPTGQSTNDLHVMMNMEDQPLAFDIPPQRNWYRAIDTFLPSPQDIMPEGQEIRIQGNQYTVNSHSVVVLISK